jgi:hypothetical protein
MYIGYGSLKIKLKKGICPVWVQFSRNFILQKFSFPNHFKLCSIKRLNRRESKNIPFYALNWFKNELWPFSRG